MDGTAKLVRMMRKTKRLSTESDFSTMYAAKYSLPNWAPKSLHTQAPKIIATAI
jgi:hypothetical protein